GGIHRQKQGQSSVLGGGNDGDETDTTHQRVDHERKALHQGRTSGCFCLSNVASHHRRSSKLCSGATDGQNHHGRVLHHGHLGPIPNAHLPSVLTIEDQ